ncbi:MAG TPA: TetR/AcrR family transcriptional regulator [Capsulimonadaceae bacterium]|nr:TetR/AcrR family transcriptional regulator [Capsulimonadaceae bacterium]
MNRRKNEEAAAGESRRAELANAAFLLIAEKGFEGLRVREVAAKAGVNIATLHYYFPTKEALVRAVSGQAQQLFADSHSAREEGGELSTVEQLQREALNLARQLRERPELCVVMTELTARASRDAGVQEVLARMDRGWRSHLAAVVMRGHRDGTIRKDLDPYRAASFLAALIKGMNYQYLSGLDRPDFAGVSEEIARWAAALSG